VPDVNHRVNELALHEIQRRFDVGLKVVERIGDDLRRPDQPGLHVLDEDHFQIQMDILESLVEHFYLPSWLISSRR